MKAKTDTRCREFQTNRVTYVVVVHGIGEQRKNETVINVVNRFAEARRAADANDNRDVLTLGQASGQTGLLNLPVGEPWMEFDGIPASSSDISPREPFLGKQSSTGDHLRFVDLCWSDVMQEAIADVGQDVGVWAKGLLGRLLRKHEDAVATKNTGARVPLWIRRVLFLLADTLILVRFGMRFRFKEMKELVFVKFLGDVQLYGEYSRCRGRAVRRFHEVMKKIEDAHYAREREQGRSPQRVPRYVIIAHSLGSIMSFDALLYARAASDVRRGADPDWKFPGYLRDEDKAPKSGGLSGFDALDTCWIRRVESFVTLGSPIDKYLTIWWLNYRHLMCDDLFEQSDSLPIAHFNYCDELDPVGHNLDVAQQTPAYRKIFRCHEDVVFNRYAIPGAAHNEYWRDQGLFKWILSQAVDGQSAVHPRWFRPIAYRKLLFALYSLVPLVILLGTYASLSLSFQVHGWRTAITAAAAFASLGYFGHRLIDLSIWWRQIQRQKSETFWSGLPGGDADRDIRRRAARRFRCLVRVVPGVWAAVATAALGGLIGRASQNEPSLGLYVVGSSVRLLLIAAVCAVVVCLLRSRSLPVAYRTGAVDTGRESARALAWLWVLGFVGIGVVVALLGTRFVFPVLAELTVLLGHVALIAVLATAIYSYRLYRFAIVKSELRNSKPKGITYLDYASHP